MEPGKSEQLLLTALKSCDFSNPLWRNCLSHLQMKKTRGRSIVMKRRARLDRRFRPRNGVENKVRKLKKLVPNCESMGAEGLFRETADYIEALQTRVKVMQIIVDMISGTADE